MATAARSSADSDRLFYSGMGLAVALTVFAGFARTYYLSHWFAPPARMPPMTPLLHVHAVVFTLWTVLLVVQPLLIASGNRLLHRRLGAFAAITAAAVWLLGNLTSIAAMNHGFRGVGDPYAFYAVTFFSIQSFGILILLAILWRKHAEAHKRLILLSSAAILEAAFGRLPLDIMAQAAPFSFYVGSDLLILGGILYDRANRGSVHKVWMWGGGALVLSQFLRIAIMQTEPWLAFAHWVASLA
jgi:hypothetical protein